MRVAMLSINLGEYRVFWKKFYESSKENFLHDYSKTYFIFTDAKRIEYQDNEDVNVIPHEDMGWPFNTMRRFHLFMTLKDELEKFDYVFFANANAEFVYPLTTEILLPNKNLIAVEHPGRHGDPLATVPFERRKESRAYISEEEGRIYVQGAFIGGKGKSFVEMCETLDQLTEADIEEGIIAVVHDESFLNMYVNKRNDVQILGWQYLYFEDVIRPYIPVIMLRSKIKYLSKTNARYAGVSRFKYSVLGTLRNFKWWILIMLKIYKWYEIKDKNGHYIDLDISGRKDVPSLRKGGEKNV